MNVYQAVAWIAAVLALMFVVLLFAMWLDGLQDRHATKHRRHPSLHNLDDIDVITHAAPLQGTDVTTCCGRSIYNLPQTDRVTTNPELVTCRG